MVLKLLIDRHTPPLVKVLVRQCGYYNIFVSIFQPLALISISSIIIIIVPNNLTIFVIISIIILLLIVFIKFRQADILGNILLCQGIIYQNMSNESKARIFYLLAIRLLENRADAYRKLTEITKRENIMELIQLICTNEKRITSDLALILAKNWLNAGDIQKAITYYEMCDSLKGDDETRLKLAELYFNIGNPSRCLEFLKVIKHLEDYGNLHYLIAKANRTLGNLEEALNNIDSAIRIRHCNADYYYEKGLILEHLDLLSEAIKQYDKSLYVHEKNPDSYCRKALLHLKNGQIRAAKRNLRKCLYYDNTNTQAYIFLQRLKKNRKLSNFIPDGKTAPVKITNHEGRFTISKGHTISLRLSIISTLPIEKCLIVALEPYGGGLEVHEREKYLKIIEKDKSYEIVFDVIAKRPSTVNLNKPWVLNVIFYNESYWTNKLIFFEVEDESEGEIYFVLTEDHETSYRSGKILNETRFDITLEQARVDLIDKSAFANKVANRYGIKWTHMIDVGTALGLMRFAGSVDTNWNKFYEDLKNYYTSAYRSGHDCQLHIHLVALPESYFFCYNYSKSTKNLVFVPDKKKRFFPLKQQNSWANVVPVYGNPKKIDTRLGSLTFIKNELENILCSESPNHRAVLFRAGQWDLGNNIGEIETSALALKKAGILADSSAMADDNKWQNNFNYGRPPHKTAFFCCKNDLRREAKSLQECGIMEIVPVNMPQGRHPVTPQSSPKIICKAYKSFFDDKKIKPGRHIIMEIEHIVTINNERNKDILDSNYGSWKYIKDHFEKISKECNRLKYVKASEAIYSFFDYYSPELIVKLEKPLVFRDELNNTVKLIYNIRFLGEGIITKKAKRYKVEIPMPHIKIDTIRFARIIMKEKITYTFDDIKKNQLRFNLSLSNLNKDMYQLEITLQLRSNELPSA